MNNTTETAPVLNGNKFVKEPHVFQKGSGTFFPTLKAAHKRLSPNGVGYWEKTLEFEGSTYYQCGNTNTWD